MQETLSLVKIEKFRSNNHASCQNFGYMSLNSSWKITAPSTGRIENYDCCRETGQLCILRQNPNLIVFSLPGLYQVNWTSLTVGSRFGLNLSEMSLFLVQLMRIMPTTHWRCQLGQSEELGQRSLKKYRMCLFRTYGAKWT